jgi:hypothetical protein
MGLKPRPSSIEIARMETATVWPGRYLGHVPQLLRTVQAVALARSRDRDVAHAAGKLALPGRLVRRWNCEGLHYRRRLAARRAGGVLMDSTIAPLPRAVTDYIAAFDLAAMCRYADGRLGVTRNPAGASAAWWCEAVKAGPVIRAARRHSGDIPAAARELGVPVTDHARVLARAKHAVAKIEAGMAWAQRTGVLHEFNQEYRRRRLEAQRRGERFMGYAMARLRRALTKVAANGTAPVAIVQEGFRR